MLTFSLLKQKTIEKVYFDKVREKQNVYEVFFTLFIFYFESS
jgi:hypothetical protein